MTRTRCQRGDTLVFTLVALLVVFIGFLYGMRNVMMNSLVTGNSLVRQKDAQVADIALKNLEGIIFQTYGGQPLEFTANGALWFRSVPATTPGPDAAYWATCTTTGGGTAPGNCGQIPLGNAADGATPLPYVAWAVVQPAGRADPFACQLSGSEAVYYNVFIHVVEASGVTSASTQALIKVCTLS